MRHYYYILYSKEGKGIVLPGNSYDYVHIVELDMSKSKMLKTEKYARYTLIKSTDNRLKTEHTTYFGMGMKIFYNYSRHISKSDMFLEFI